MANELQIIVGATDKASPVLGKISGNIEDMGQKMTKAGGIMMAAGVGIVGSLVAITTKSAKAGAAIYDMSKRTGMGTVALSELKYAAELSGTSLEGLETGIKRMQRVIVDASSGVTSATDALTTLGLTFEDVAGKTPEEQFNILFTAIASIEDPTLRAAAAQDIFGKSGTDLLPMLADGATGLQDMKDKAHELGVVFDEEAAANADKFDDSLTALKASLAGAGEHIAEVLMPILTDLLTNKVIPMIEKVTDWIEKNKGLVEILLKVGAVLAVGGAVLIGIGAVARAIIAVNAALIIMQALIGPAGWIKIAVGAAVAAAAIISMNEMIGDIGGSGPSGPHTTPDYPAGYDWSSDSSATILPHGSTVPGAQHGGVVRKHSLLQVAEAGPEAIIPLSNFGMGGASAPPNVTVHDGGVVRKHNLLQVAEAGPEAIIPLSNFGMGGASAPPNVTVHVYGSVITKNQLVDEIYEGLLQKKGRNYSLGLT